MNTGPFVAKLRHIDKTRSYQKFAVAALLGLWISDMALGGKLLAAENSLWKGILDPLVGAFTLMTAVFIWWGEGSEEWLNSLPKRLTVEFWHKRRLVMRCEDADLGDEADIRNLGQQIGQQMNDNHRLFFKAPAIRYGGGELKRAEGGGYFRAYSVVFELTRLPEAAEKLDWEGGEYLLWTPPFDGEPEPKKMT